MSRTTIDIDSNTLYLDIQIKFHYVSWQWFWIMGVGSSMGVIISIGHPSTKVPLKLLKKQTKTQFSLKNKSHEFLFCNHSTINLAISPQRIFYVENFLWKEFSKMFFNFSPQTVTLKLHTTNMEMNKIQWISIFLFYFTSKH